MTTTGWTGEEPDARPPLPVTEMMLARRERRAGVLETALARSAAADARAARDEAAGARDPDEYAANLVTRGYMPGQISQLAMRLADTVAELADEEDKIEKAARRAERTRQMHERGQISGFDLMARMRDTDEGDQATADRLRRRADSLRRQIAEASEAISPPERRDPDPLEAASRRAHEVFREVTRQRWAEAQGRAPAPRPFGSPSRGGAGVAVRSEPVTCPECLKCGATPEQSFLIHQDPDAPIEAEFVDLSEQTLAAFGRAGAEQAEVDRLQALGYSAETARLAARPNDAGMAVR